MKEETIYLSLGTNIGDKAANLRAAITSLADLSVRVTRVSSIYETEPVDYLDQAWFLNCVVEGQTEVRPVELLRRLRKLETQMGSKKEFVKGPRLIDLDILLYGDEIIDVPGLKVPHPRMHLRRFVLVPLTEIAPTLHHPSWPGTVADLIAATPDQSQIKLSNTKL
jgi:2-amino-4-hydroxy-6-hydroxymethyldihydropteridine diphosphokinase